MNPVERSDASTVANRPFTLFPAIDVLGGNCVRLLRGDYEAKTEYSRHPRAMAERWLSLGARFLHVVDLDAAKSGHPENIAVIREIVQAASEVGAEVQVGGGIRTTREMGAWLDGGVARCVVGSAMRNGEFVAEALRLFGPEALVAGLDGRNGKLAVHGWIQQTEVRLSGMAQELVRMGVLHALVTDVDRDGTLEGPNLVLTKDVQSTGIAAIVSGGIRNLSDVLRCQQSGFAGAIAGRSIYDGTLDVAEAVGALGSAASSSALGTAEGVRPC